MKYLVAGLGNIGQEYAHTRHNIGFDILDALAGASNISFKDRRYGFVGEMKYRARTYVLLKPSTYMNLSGNAVRYWLRKLKLPLENLLVVGKAFSMTHDASAGPRMQRDLETLGAAAAVGAGSPGR